jgi:GNAT superfamily N-acetyltransferase
MRMRRAVLADMAAVAVLHRMTVRTSLPFLPDLHTPEEDLAFFRERLFPANEVWVAEQDSELIGYAARADGWLNQLYVHPDHQGRGIGAAVLAHAMTGVDALRLWAFQKNTRARRFYEERGFVLVRMTDGSDNEEHEPDALYLWRRD